MAKMIHCTLCGERRPRAREDVIPKWLAKEFGGKSSFVQHRWDSAEGQVIRHRPRRYGSAAAYKYPNVCGPCNNEWLKDIEDEAEPVLRGMVRSQPQVLDPDAQRVLSVWAYKTALLFDAWNYPRLIPESIGTRPFRVTRLPTMPTQVLLGTHQPSDPRDSIQIRRNDPYKPDGQPLAQILSTAFTFTKASWIARMAWWEALDWPLEFVVPPNHDEVVQTWPQVHDTVEWPTSIALDLSGLWTVLKDIHFSF